MSNWIAHRRQLPQRLQTRCRHQLGARDSAQLSDRHRARSALPMRASYLALCPRAGLIRMPMRARTIIMIMEGLSGRSRGGGRPIGQSADSTQPPAAGRPRPDLGPPRSIDHVPVGAPAPPGDNVEAAPEPRAPLVARLAHGCPGRTRRTNLALAPERHFSLASYPA